MMCNKNCNLFCTTQTSSGIIQYVLFEAPCFKRILMGFEWVRGEAGVWKQGYGTGYVLIWRREEGSHNNTLAILGGLSFRKYQVRASTEGRTGFNGLKSREYKF